MCLDFVRVIPWKLHVRFGTYSSMTWPHTIMCFAPILQWAYSAGELTKSVYKPGDQHYLPYGTSKQYKIPENCWALEYARGNIISMLPFGILDTLSSTMDIYTLGQTVYISAKWMLYNVLVNGKIWRGSRWNDEMLIMVLLIVFSDKIIRWRIL